MADKPICVELTQVKGACTNIVSGKQFIVDETKKYENKTWWEQRHLMLQLPISTWVELKSWIIKVCKKHKKMCNDSISSWDRSLDYIDESIEKRGEL